MWIGFKKGKFGIYSTGLISRIVGFGLIFFLIKIHEYSITLFRLTFDVFILFIIFCIAAFLAKKENKKLKLRHFFWSIFVIVVGIGPMVIFVFFMAPEDVKDFFYWLGWIFFLHD